MSTVKIWVRDGAVDEELPPQCLFCNAAVPHFPTRSFQWGEGALSETWNLQLPLCSAHLNAGTLTPGVKQDAPYGTTGQVLDTVSYRSPILFVFWNLFKATDRPTVPRKAWVEIPGVTDAFAHALEEVRRRPAKGRRSALPWVLAGVGVVTLLLLTCCIVPVGWIVGEQWLRGASPPGIDWKALNRERPDRFFENPGQKYTYTLKVPPGTAANLKFQIGGTSENCLQIFDPQQHKLHSQHASTYGPNINTDTLVNGSGEVQTFYLVGRHKRGARNSPSSNRWNLSAFHVLEETPEKISLAWKDGSGSDFDKIKVEITFRRQ